MFSLAKNVRSQHLTDATPEEFWALVDDKETGGACAEIADALELLRRGGLQREEFDRKKSELKLHLPVAMFQGHSTTGRRLNSDMEPSGLALLDIDHVNFPEQVYGTDIRGKEKGLGILLVHKTPSGEGLRVVFRQPKGMAIEEAQRWMAGQLKFKEYDECTKDLARCSFLVPRDYIMYLDEEGLFSQAPIPLALPEGEERKTPSPLPLNGEDGQGTKFETAEVSTPLPRREGKGESLCFRGIPYSEIVREFWNCTGGVPVEGERNVRLHQLAVNLRSICDNKKEVLMQIMPRFGLSDAEVQNIVDSACKEPPKGVSKTISSIIQDSKFKIQNEEEELDEEENDSTPLHSGRGKGVGPRLRLPIGLKESLVGVPETMHMPVLCAVLPLAAAYADGVEVEYCTGERMRLGLMSIIVGEQASGKSVCKSAIDIWKRPLAETDALARLKEEQWREMRKARKANEKAPDDPKVLIRMLPVTVSCSTLLRRLKNAQGHILYSFGEELDTLRKTNAAGSWSSKYDIYRLSFDQGEWGQDYNSDQAESGVVNVAYNWTMLGTPGALTRCFRRDNVENGLSSRVLISEMPDGAFAPMPIYGHRNEEDERRVVEAAQLLSSFQGFVDTPLLRQAIGNWAEQKRQQAAKDIDYITDTYRRRSAVIGFRCGVIHHLLSKTETESEETIDFALMMAEHCLRGQVEFFSDMFSSQKADERYERYGSNKTVFEQLPTEFSYKELKALKPGATMTAIRKTVSRWYREKWVVRLEMGRWKKCATENET